MIFFRTLFLIFNLFSRLKLTMKRLLLIIGMIFLGITHAADPCKSGLQPNQRPGPYSALVSVGKERGTQHCYVCEAEDRPIAIVFARTLSEPLGNLVKSLDRAVVKNKDVEMRAWVTLMAEDQTALDPQVVKWAKRYAIDHVPIAVFEDVVGPPAYRIAADADVTVLLSVKQKVVANFAYRTGEFNEAAVQNIQNAIPKLLKK